MERKEWPPPPLAGVLSLPTAWGTASQGGGWGESGGQTQVHRRRLEALLEPLAFSEVSGFLLKKKKKCHGAFSESSQPSAACSPSLVFDACCYYDYFKTLSFLLLYSANCSSRKPPHRGNCMLEGSYSQKLDTGADKHLSNI